MTDIRIKKGGDEGRSLKYKCCEKIEIMWLKSEREREREEENRISLLIVV